MQELIRESYKLKDGTKVPKIGFGCYNPRKQDYVTILKTAIDAGYRYFDTASLYETERDLAKALKESGIDRKEVQIASKAWYDELGYEETKAAFNRTLERLETDYLDFYLLHWPKASEDDPYWKEKDRSAWKALTELKKAGKIRHIGVCNFLPHHLEILTDANGCQPEIDQLELHIGYSQELAREYCQKQDILVQAWAPLGRGRLNDDPVLGAMAAKYQKTFSQIAIRFLLQKGIMPIPKASTREHMLDNANVFDFELSREDMWMLSCMPQRTWQGEHPDFAVPKKASNPLQ